MIDEMANCPDLQTSAGKSCNHRSRKGSKPQGENGQSFM